MGHNDSNLEKGCILFELLGARGEQPSSQSPESPGMAKEKGKGKNNNNNDSISKFLPRAYF
jgi:hypothetical protein